MAVYGTLVNSDASGATGVRNMLINGDFRVWQKGTDLNTATVGQGISSADRWVNQYADFAPRIRKVEDTLTNGETVDTAEITKISGTYASCEFSQKVETTVAKYLRGRTVTFSFWIKKVGATFGSHQYDCWIGDSETVDDTGWTNQRTADRGRVTRPTGMAAAVNFTDNTWRKITITRTLTSDTNTIYCTIYTQNTPTNEGIRIANCQLELGSIATPFEKRPLAMELQMCQRYYQAPCGSSTSGIGQGGIGNFYAITTSEAFNTINFPVPMRTTPTVTFYNGGGTSGGAHGLGTTGDITGVTLDRISSQGLGRMSKSSGLTVGYLYAVIFQANAEF
jgi:hypothetical protein